MAATHGGFTSIPSQNKDDDPADGWPDDQSQCSESGHDSLGQTCSSYDFPDDGISGKWLGVPEGVSVVVVDIALLERLEADAAQNKDYGGASRLAHLTNDLRSKLSQMERLNDRISAHVAARAYREAARVEEERAGLERKLATKRKAIQDEWGERISTLNNGWPDGWGTNEPSSEGIKMVTPDDAVQGQTFIFTRAQQFLKKKKCSFWLSLVALAFLLLISAWTLCEARNVSAPDGDPICLALRFATTYMEERATVKIDLRDAYYRGSLIIHPPQPPPKPPLPPAPHGVVCRATHNSDNTRPRCS